MLVRSASRKGYYMILTDFQKDLARYLSNHSDVFNAMYDFLDDEITKRNANIFFSQFGRTVKISSQKPSEETNGKEGHRLANEIYLMILEATDVMQSFCDNKFIYKAPFNANKEEGSYETFLGVREFDHTSNHPKMYSETMKNHDPDINLQFCILANSEIFIVQPAFNKFIASDKFLTESERHHQETLQESKNANKIAMGVAVAGILAQIILAFINKPVISIINRFFCK